MASASSSSSDPPRATRVRPFHRWFLLATSALVGLTGLAYFWMDRMMRPVDEFAVINHPLQPLVLKTHIVLAPLLVFGLGLIATDHIWRHYRTGVRRARRTGTTTMWLLAPMVLSGYLIQAVTRPTLLSAVAWTHIGTSVLYLGLLAAHQVVVSRGVARAGRLRRRRDG